MAAALAMLYTLLSFAYQFVLTPAQQGKLAVGVRDSLGYWDYALILGLLFVILILYDRLVPRVDIVFDDKDPRFVLIKNGARRYRVDLVNYGDYQDNVSFRLEYVKDSAGNLLPIDRKGFQREAGKGPMPLSPESPKYGYLAALVERDGSSSIHILTTSDLASGYQDDPVILEPGTYYVVASLNPRIGRPCQRCFKLFIDQANRLRMELVDA